LITKYQVDCFDTDKEGIHPLLKDYWFLRRIAELQVSPRPFYLSYSSPLPFRQTLKSGFRMSIKERTECFRSGGKVRFMVMEKVGESLHAMSRRYANGKVPLVNVLSLGTKMMKIIRKLHDEGQVVHGDIHAGNICFSRTGNSLRLIDFGRANLVTSAEDGVPSLEREPFSWHDPLFSHWNIEGYRETRRDDVFKVFLVMAMLLNGKTYLPHLKDRLNDQQSYEFKRNGNIFEIPGSSIEGWTECTASVLSEILAIVRATELDARPDYESILSKLSELGRTV
jgi:serine/threonine protein kinase